MYLIAWMLNEIPNKYEFGFLIANWYSKLWISGAFYKHPGGYDPWSTKSCPWYCNKLTNFHCLTELPKL